VRDTATDTRLLSRPDDGIVLAEALGMPTETILTYDDYLALVAIDLASLWKTSIHASL
jgi:hypothetical protein